MGPQKKKRTIIPDSINTTGLSLFIEFEIGMTRSARGEKCCHPPNGERGF